jgi:hypothetical protein
MGYKRISIIVSALLLSLLSACQMTGVTPAPQPPGAGIIANNPGGPVQLAPTSTTPTTAPPHQGGCNQTGCPYPAVCDQTSGVCTINQPQGPGAAAPQAPGGVGPIAANPDNPNPGSIIPPACAPLTIGPVIPFCANQSAKLGGVSFTDSQQPDNILIDLSALPKGADCSQPDPNISKVVCSGPIDANLQLLVCSSCGNFPGYDTSYFSDPNLFKCSKGYVKEWQGSGYGNWYCIPLSGWHANNVLDNEHFCPAGTHFDNALQNCADDTTGKLANPCPPDYPYYYISMSGFCWKQKVDITYNCQTLSAQLGECLTPKKNPGPGPCTYNPMTGTCK